MYNQEASEMFLQNGFQHDRKLGSQHVMSLQVHARKGSDLNAIVGTTPTSHTQIKPHVSSYKTQLPSLWITKL